MRLSFGFWCIDAWNAKYSKTHAFRSWHKKYPYPKTVCGEWPHPQFSEDLVRSKKSDLSCGRCRRALRLTE